MKLVIGANDRQLPGWKHHDVKPYPGIDIVCDFWDLPDKVALNSCSELQATHFLEHFPTKDTQKVLALMMSLLKPGGSLYIEVPNFAWHAELVRDGRAEEAVYYAFGGQLDEWDFHKTAFTPTLLQKALTQAGFINIDIDGWTTLCCKCQKSL